LFFKVAAVLNMDDSEAYIDGEFLEEIVTVDDNTGGQVLQASGSHHLGLGGRVKHPAYLKKAVHHDEEEELEEEHIPGQIIEGEDGEYYVVMDDDGADDIELDDDIRTVEVDCTDDGEQVLVFQSNPANPHSRVKRTRMARAVLQEDTDGQQVEMIQFIDRDDRDGGPQIDLAVGAIQTAEANDDLMLQHGMVLEPIPQGMKMRRTRVYGTCRCQDCGQSFVNTARLERHLAVHQVFGSFLCPLCGKTYKYEYNLFYHWRRTCRDLNDLMTQDDRKTMDVNALRSLVDEVAQKKAEYGPIEIGISRSVLFQSGPLARLEMPSNPLGRRGTTCRACGVVVHQAHLAHHLNLHKGIGNCTPDERSPVGGFYCDLCGLMFRQHFNLIKHWRTNCAEIQCNLPEDVELTLDDGQLKGMVTDLLKRACTSEAILEAETQRVKMSGPDGRRMMGNEHIDVVGYDVGDDDLMPGARRERERDEAEANREHEEERRAFEESSAAAAARGEYIDEPGIVFADDFEDDEVLLMGEEAAAGVNMNMNNRAKWNMSGGPIQCAECYRSFANPGRLERHMAGFHASHGSHHCALCGNRFKYDYNLLYHYRKSCPYTKSFIDADVRNQMDAGNLRKLVRSLAQKDLRLQAQTRPMMRLPKAPTQQSNDAMIRREMMRPILASAPQVLTQARRGMSGKACPICGVMFYSSGSIQSHMTLRHNVEYPMYDEDERDAELQYDEMPAASAASGGVLHRSGAAAIGKGAHKKGPVEPLDDDEAPPTLEIQQPGEEAVQQKQQQGSGVSDGRSRFLSSSHHHHAIDAHSVQEMYERGEIRDGDIIYVQEGDREVEYTVNDESGEMDDELEGVGEEEEQAIDDAAEEEAAFAAEQKRMRQAQQLAMSSRQQQQHQRRYAAGGESSSGMRQMQQQQQRGSSAGAAARKRPRNEERSVWDDDLLEDEELEQLQREVDQRRADEAAARGASAGPRGRGGLPSIMQRRGA
ncbi:hypothetical protein PFISCL1PPCAC_22771, partial [Pristionchus fissidentatus]